MLSWLTQHESVRERGGGAPWHHGCRVCAAQAFCQARVGVAEDPLG